MKKSATSLLVTACTVAAFAQRAPHDPLASLRDHARPVLIFAGAGDARVNDQYAALQENTDGMKDRQMQVVLITATPVGKVYDGEPPPATSVPPAAEQEALRKRFHVAPDQFAVILIGKDGGEKLRSDKPIPWLTLQSTIDGMPMRQQEMRDRAE